MAQTPSGGAKLSSGAVPAVTGADYPDSDHAAWQGSIPPPDDEDPLVNEVLSSTYQVVRILGEGGMGRVYEAQHTRIASKRFALKVLHPEFARRKDVLARFQREVEAAASITSPHVVGVYDVDQTEDGRPYLVSELLEGSELGEHLEKVGRLQTGRAVAIVRQICRALDAAHAKGVVHRDMKPENVFLASNIHDPVVKVLDFGISRLDGQEGTSLTKTGMVMGTPSYMAPEQAKGLRVDHRCDVYAVGAILYRCLTGKVPFDRPDATATLAAVLTEEPEPPRSINPEIPQALELVIQRAMAQEPEERYGSMAELDAALAPFDDDELDQSGEVSIQLSVRRQTLASDTKMSAAARDVNEARPQLALFGAVILVGAIVLLVSVVGAVVRLTHDPVGPLSSTEALVIGAIMLAAFSTPLVLLLRSIKQRTWGNTARVVELVGALREPLAVGLGTYGLGAILSRFVENVIVRSPAGVASPWWDIGLPVLAVAAGLGTYIIRRGPARIIDRTGAVGPLAGALAAVFFLTVVPPIALRTTENAAVVADGSEQADDQNPSDKKRRDDGAPADETKPAVKGPALPGAEPASKPQPVDKQAAWKLWEEAMDDLKKNKLSNAIEKLPHLFALDPRAGEDASVRSGIGDLFVRTCRTPGPTCDRLTTLLTTDLAEVGCDVFYAVMTTRGGSRAAVVSTKLLEDESLRKKGTNAMRIAYELRTAKTCDAKEGLYEGAKQFGDHRALTELKLMTTSRQCKLSGCCVDSKDEKHAATVRAILDRTQKGE